jgi:hypothetical protein
VVSFVPAGCLWVVAQIDSAFRDAVLHHGKEHGALTTETACYHASMRQLIGAAYHRLAKSVSFLSEPQDADALPPLPCDRVGIFMAHFLLRWGALHNDTATSLIALHAAEPWFRGPLLRLLRLVHFDWSSWAGEEMDGARCLSLARAMLQQGGHIPLGQVDVNELCRAGVDLVSECGGLFRVIIGALAAGWIPFTLLHFPFVSLYAEISPGKNIFAVVSDMALYKELRPAYLRRSVAHAVGTQWVCGGGTCFGNADEMAAARAWFALAGTHNAALCCQYVVWLVARCTTTRRERLLDMYFAYGADPNWTWAPTKGEEPLPLLHLAIRNHKVRWRVVVLLLRHGADPTLPSTCGDTALHAAVRYGRGKMLRALAVPYGAAMLTVRDAEGLTPLARIHCAPHSVLHKRTQKWLLARLTASTQ